MLIIALGIRRARTFRYNRFEVALIQASAAMHALPHAAT